MEDYTGLRYESSIYPEGCEEYYDKNGGTSRRNYGEGYPHSEVHPTSHYDGGIIGGIKHLALKVTITIKK